MFIITNLIEPRMGKLILNHLTGNNCPEFHNGLLDSYFFKLTLGSDFGNFVSESRFENHPDSVILQKYQSFSNQRFKQNSMHMSSLNLTPKLSFKPRFGMYINGYYTKKKTLDAVLDSLLYFDLNGKLANSKTFESLNIIKY